MCRSPVQEAAYGLQHLRWREQVVPGRPWGTLPVHGHCENCASLVKILAAVCSLGSWATLGRSPSKDWVHLQGAFSVCYFLTPYQSSSSLVESEGLRSGEEGTWGESEAALGVGIGAPWEAGRLGGAGEKVWLLCRCNDPYLDNICGKVVC